MRFRTAIKEPEELSYPFLTLGIGLGLGAYQWLVTITAFCVIVAVLWLRAREATSDDGANLYLTVRQQGAAGSTLTAITGAIETHCAGLDLERFDDAGDAIEASYRVRFENVEQLERAKQALHALGGSVSLGFVDQESPL